MIFQELAQLENVTVELENAKTRRAEDMQTIMSRLRTGRSSSASSLSMSLVSEAQAKQNIQDTNRRVEKGIREGIKPALELLKVDNLFNLMPKLAIEHLVLRLVFTCFGWTARQNDAPWEETSNVDSASNVGSFTPSHLGLSIRSGDQRSVALLSATGSHEAQPEPLHVAGV